jgi:hypothetical protein
LADQEGFPHGCSMTTTILCRNCQHRWSVAGALSVHQQLEMLSRPCPVCEAYTLSCLEPVPPRWAERYRPLWRQDRLRGSLRAPAP